MVWPCLLSTPILLLLAGAAGAVECPGDRTYETAAGDGCTSITGDLTIHGTSLTNIDGLAALTLVGGSLYIQENAALADLAGLAVLVSVGGSLDITGNLVLPDLDGLSALASVGGYFDIGFNDNLSSIDGLSSLVSVGENFVIYWNESLATIDGLTMLAEVGYLGIFYNDQLTDILGLSSFTHHAGSIDIIGHLLLTGVSGFSGLASVGGSFGIYDSAAIADVDGLSALAFVGGDLDLYNNNALVDLGGLSALASVGGDLRIYDNADLCSALVDEVVGGIAVGGAVTSFDNNGFCEIYSGDGKLDPGEFCDDGNTLDGDCCTSTCSFEAAGSPCLDLDLCNGDESCDGAGGCEAESPLDCADGDLCTRDLCDSALGCQNAAEPEPSCLDTWGRGSLLIKETVTGNEKFIAKLVKGPEILSSDFGDPTLPSGTSYQACLYGDDGSYVGSLVLDQADLLCETESCWRDLGPKGFVYKDPNASSSGIKQLRLTAGPDGKSRIKIIARNKSSKGQDQLPTGLAAGLVEVGGATLQLFGSDDRECFSIDFMRVRKQEDHVFSGLK